MKKLLAAIFSFIGMSAFAQTGAASGGQLAPGALGNVDALLNKPALARPVAVTPLGKNWFRIEADVHVFTDEASVRQIAAVLLDMENYSKHIQGKRTRLSASVVQRNGDETIVDFVSTAISLGIRINTPYRASVRTTAHTESKIHLELSQLASDIAANNSVKNLSTSRYAEAVTVGGKEYTYFRFVNNNEVNASILPGARNILGNSSEAANVEMVELIINAAKAKE